jgi:hypothetical protein
LPILRDFVKLTNTTTSSIIKKIGFLVKKFQKMFQNLLNGQSAGKSVGMDMALERKATIRSLLDSVDLKIIVAVLVCGP